MSVGSGPLNSTGIDERVPDFGDGLTRDDILSISSRDWFRKREFPTVFRNEIKNGAIHIDESSMESIPIWIKKASRDDLKRGYGIRDHQTELKESKYREDQYREDSSSSNRTPEDLGLDFGPLKFDENKYEYVFTTMPAKVRDNLDKESRNSLAAEFLLDNGRFETGKTEDTMKKIEQELQWTYHFMEILRRKKVGKDYLDCRWEATGK